MGTAQMAKPAMRGPSLFIKWPPRPPVSSFASQPAMRGIALATTGLVIVDWGFGSR